MSALLALVERLHFPFIIVLISVGLWLWLGADGLLKRVAGLALAHSALVLFFLASGFAARADAPLLAPGEAPFARRYSDPAPQALMLGVIVGAAGAAALALALVVRIREAYGLTAFDALAPADADAEAEAQAQAQAQAQADAEGPAP